MTTAVIADRGRVSAVIADDAPLLRAMLRTRLSRLWPELEVVHEMADGRGVEEVLEQHDPGTQPVDDLESVVGPGGDAHRDQPRLGAQQQGEACPDGRL